MPLLPVRSTINIGTWNIPTIWKTERTIQIAAELRRYNLMVLGISETYWTQSGQEKLGLAKMLLYSGHEDKDALHTQGVELMPVKEAGKTFIGWGSGGPRIIKTSFKTKKEGINECHPMLSNH
ncbi:unnamed protein product [Schistosoma curassoni]|uniref:Endo/exonuclease/phosphatase domain-containing protein n=1 Tax=Schistosoma curassoni TaxID=6186 RepID=A0A183KD01_9TREM|nr:unnamed protein product [Schistosoma curassoni]